MGKSKESKLIEELQVAGLGLARAGLKIKHATFGKGVIEEINEFSDGTNTIRVMFDKAGSKALVPEYANLKKRLW